MHSSNTTDTTTTTGTHKTINQSCIIIAIHHLATSMSLTLAHWPPNSRCFPLTRTRSVHLAVFTLFTPCAQRPDPLVGVEPRPNQRTRVPVPGFPVYCQSAIPPLLMRVPTVPKPEPLVSAAPHHAPLSSLVPSPPPAPILRPTPVTTTKPSLRRWPFLACCRLAVIEPSPTRHRPNCLFDLSHPQSIPPSIF